MSKKKLDEQKVIEDAIDTVAQKQEEDESEFYTTDSGIKLRFRPVGTYSVGEVFAEFPTPEPPMVYHPTHPEDETKMIPNPLSPTYKEELHKANVLRSRAINDIALTLGVEFLDEIPEENDDWIEKLVILGKIPPQENPSIHLKRLWYLKYMTTDYMKIIERLGRASSSPTKEGVDQARSSFQSSEGRLSDRGSEDKE